MNDVFYLTEEQRMIRDLARKVARDRIAPTTSAFTRGGTSRDENTGAKTKIPPTRAATSTNATSCAPATSGSAGS